MRINIITSLIAVGLSALLGYAVYSVAGNDENATLAFVVSSICFLVGLLFAFGVSYNDSKKGVSLRVFSFLVVLVFCNCSVCFCSVWYNTKLLYHHIGDYSIVIFVDIQWYI